MENIQQAYGFIEKETGYAFKRCVKKEDSCVKINTDRLKKFHQYIIREIIRKAIEEIQGNLLRFGYAHWIEIASLLYERPQVFMGRSVTPGVAFDVSVHPELNGPNLQGFRPPQDPFDGLLGVRVRHDHDQVFGVHGA